jgi:hypothetical protein
LQTFLAFDLYAVMLKQVLASIPATVFGNCPTLELRRQFTSCCHRYAAAGRAIG